MTTATPWPYQGTRRRPSDTSVKRSDLPDWAGNPKRRRRRDGMVVEVYAIGALA